MKIIANGRIDIWMESNNETNILHFRDNGPGIARERLPHMFENYKTQGKQGGTGLGLPFCKRALISFNGSIECLSELGEWTEFVMSFPKCNEAPSTEEDEEDISLGEIQKLIDNKTILLVDDDNLIRMVMKARLKEFNVTIIEAQQGKEAIDILDKRDVDLIFMDIQMPEIDGLETTKQIRSGIHFKNFQNYKDVPIIALSGNAEDDKILIQESGMSDYLTKSMTKEELFIAIRKWLKFSANKKYTK
jgi:two-component system autoinducer 1 sensor kinase/phosphatase LuxN